MNIHGSLGDGKMELPQQVVAEAKRLVGEGAVLSAFIPESAGFYVAEGDDISILAFGAFEVRGVDYKIGTKK